MPKENSRRYDLDVLRIFAISAVVLMHSAGFVDDDVSSSSVLWISSIIFGYITRFAVPVFVMISGSLILQRQDISMKTLFSKYLLRLACAYYFWAFVYTLVYSYFAYFNGELSVIAIKNLISGTLSGGYFHLWYMPMILGLYVLSPVLRAFLRGSTKNTIVYWGIVCFFICFGIPLLNHVEIFSEIFGDSLDHFCNNAWGLYVFYFILGYVIDNNEIPTKWLRIIYCGGIIGALVSIFLVGYASVRTGTLRGELAANNTINVFLMSVALFLYIRNACGNNWKPKHARIIEKLSKYAFGVYLVHELVIVEIHSYVFSHSSEVFAIPILFFAGITISYLIVWIIAKIKPIAKYII